MNIELTRAERQRLERYAEAFGLATVEEALMHAARAELQRRYQLPTQKGAVVPLHGRRRDRERT